MFRRLKSRVLALERLALQALFLMVCMTISLDGSLRLVLLSMNSFQRECLEPLISTEGPVEEVPGPQEPSSDGPASSELPEVAVATALPGEGRKERPTRFRIAVQQCVRQRTQRALQVHSGSVIVFENQYRNGCGAHLRC